MLNKRTTILLDEETQNLLLSIANREKTSVGDLVRKAIEETYKKRRDETIKRRTEVVRQIQALRKKMKPLGKITFRELIEYGRYR